MALPEPFDRVKQYPEGPATELAVAAAATMAVTVNNQETVITISQMTAPGTLNLTLDSVKTGANLLVKVSADGTGRTLTFGTNMTAVAYAIGASKSVAITFKYDGSKFIHVGTTVLN